jgi:hypothetical protein
MRVSPNQPVVRAVWSAHAGTFRGVVPTTLRKETCMSKFTRASNVIWRSIPPQIRDVDSSCFPQSATRSSSFWPLRSRVRAVLPKPAVIIVGVEKVHMTRCKETDAPDFSLRLREGGERSCERTCAKCDEKFAAIVHSSTLVARIRIN